jgi:hypothetical protein
MAMALMNTSLELVLRDSKRTCSPRATKAAAK